MTYSVAYFFSWVNTAVLIVCGVLSASNLLFHPSWLTNDIAATAGILVLICGGFATILPPITRTPGSRETKYLNARLGALPEDLEAKHGRKPLDTLPPAA